MRLWKLCMVGFSFNSQAEVDYAPIEGECLWEEGHSTMKSSVLGVMSYIMLGIIFKSYSSRGFTLRSQSSERRKEDLLFQSLMLSNTPCLPL